ncbi:hypothetical protein [Nonomuraea sp. 10N515B]|uniref:hypothetical protein n=1 Tax=Nonomuraea sp. 10N515B TaxID=3457422 RepID=UPI003FCDC2A0
MAARTLVAPGKVSGSRYGSHTPASESQISDRQAIAYMGDVLDRLAVDGVAGVAGPRG